MSQILCYIFWPFSMDLTDWWAPAPCQGSKGPDVSGSDSKGSQCTVFLLKETAVSTKPSRTMLLSPNYNCADSGRRNTKLNCRDADASVDRGHPMSPDFPGWILTSKSGEKTPRSKRVNSVIQSHGLLPYICRMRDTEKREPVFLNPLKNLGFSFPQKRAIWPNDTFQLCSATQPRC